VENLYVLLLCAVVYPFVLLEKVVPNRNVVPVDTILTTGLTTTPSTYTTYHAARRNCGDNHESRT
jgi:hypothetical protein